MRLVFRIEIPWLPGGPFMMRYDKYLWATMTVSMHDGARTYVGRNLEFVCPHLNGLLRNRDGAMAALS